MLIQDQLPHDKVDDEHLSFYRSIGVDYLAIYPPPFGVTGRAGGDGNGVSLRGRGEMAAYSARARQLAESHGLRLKNLALGGPDAITLGLPERDAAIEEWCDVLYGPWATPGCPPWATASNP